MAFLDQHVVYPSFRLFKCVCVCVCRAISNLNLFLCGNSLWSLPSSMWVCVCVGQYKAFFKQLNDFCAQTIDSLLLLYNLIEAYSSWPNEMLTNSNKSKNNNSNNNSKWHLKYCIRERSNCCPNGVAFVLNSVSVCICIAVCLSGCVSVCLTWLPFACFACIKVTCTHIHTYMCKYLQYSLLALFTLALRLSLPLPVDFVLTLNCINFNYVLHKH